MYACTQKSAHELWKILPPIAEMDIMTTWFSTELSKALWFRLVTPSGMAREGNQSGEVNSKMNFTKGAFKILLSPSYMYSSLNKSPFISIGLTVGPLLNLLQMVWVILVAITWPSWNRPLYFVKMKGNLSARLFLQFAARPTFYIFYGKCWPKYQWFTVFYHNCSHSMAR